MKNIFYTLLICFIGSISMYSQNAKEKESVNLVLDSWHRAASEANFKNYFDKLSEDAIFIGTDATENWNKKQFEEYSRPFFDKGKAWSFTSLERNIYFSPDKKMAWFDELLDTQMKICRGSGVLEKTKNGWKIKQYVLSMTIPNDNGDEVIKTKSEIENKLLDKLRKL